MKILVAAYAPAGTWKHDLLRAARDAGHETTLIPSETPGRDVLRAARGHDVFLWVRTHGRDMCGDAQRALERLAEGGVRTIGLHLDKYWGLAGREYEIGRTPFWLCQTVWTADGDPRRDWAGRGVNHRWCPPAATRAQLTQGIPRVDQFPFPIVFTGQRRYPHAQWTHRAELIQWLEDHYRYSFAWYGPGSPHGEAYGAALASLFATAKVVVGDACLVGEQTHCYSDRLPITLGHGGFLIHPHIPGVTDGTIVTAGQHLATWQAGDWGGLREQIERWLAPTNDDLRREVAAAGAAHIAAHHTFDQRLAQILEP